MQPLNQVLNLPPTQKSIYPFTEQIQRFVDWKLSPSAIGHNFKNSVKFSNFGTFLNISLILISDNCNN